MSGRRLFEMFRPILRLFILLFSITPGFIVSFLWDIISIYQGKPFVALRYILLKAKAKNVGDNVNIGKYVVLKNIHKLSLGSNVSIHDFCYFDAAGEIEIGDNVSIAHNTSILSTDHTWGDPDLPIKYNTITLKKTTLKNDIWIGCGVRILGGVTINERAVVAAGCIVNKDVEMKTLVGGIPVKKIKNI